MTVASETNKIQYTADGTVGPYTYNFRIDADTDLLVVETDTATGTDTTKTLTTQYTVSGVGNPAGGTVTFVSGQQPANGKRITLQRVVPLTQGLDLLTSGDLPAESVEKVLDKVVFMAQQLDEAVDRSVKVPRSSTLSQLEIPDPAVAANAGKFFRVKADNTGVEVVTVNDGAEASLLTTKGDLLGHTGAAPGRVSVGANHTIPVADSGQSFGWIWKTLESWWAAVFGTPTKGDLLVRGASAWGRKAVGSVGKVLRSAPSESDGTKYEFVGLGETFQGLVLGNHPDADKAASSVYMAQCRYLVTNRGTMIKPRAGLSASLTTSGAGGLDTGTEQSSVMYEVYYVFKGQDSGSPDNPESPAADALVFHRAKDYLEDTNYASGDDNAHGLRAAASNTRLAQGFQLNAAGPVEFVDVKLQKVGSPTGNYWFTIESNASGLPSGTVLATSDKYNVSLLTTTATWVRMPFRTPASLSAATQYHLVLHGDFAISGVNYLNWRVDSTAGAYAGGSKAAYDGSVWTADADDDFQFEIHVTRNNTPLTLPSGYTEYCLVCPGIYNDASGDLLRFLQRDRSIFCFAQAPESTSANDEWTIFAAGSGPNAPTLYHLGALVPPRPCVISVVAGNTAGAASYALGHITATWFANFKSGPGAGSGTYVPTATQDGHALGPPTEAYIEYQGVMALSSTNTFARINRIDW